MMNLQYILISGYMDAMKLKKELFIEFYLLD